MNHSHKLCWKGNPTKLIKSKETKRNFFKDQQLRKLKQKIKNKKVPVRQHLAHCDIMRALSFVDTQCSSGSSFFCVTRVKEVEHEILLSCTLNKLRMKTLEWINSKNTYNV